MTPAQHIDRITRDWHWKPFASPYETAKDILKLFGRRRDEKAVATIANLLWRNWERPWCCTGQVLEIVEAAGRKRAVVEGRKR